MNTAIEIYDNNENISGTYEVWFKDDMGANSLQVLDANHVNALLTMSQKERFFNGSYKFKVASEYDFKTIVVNGQKRQGL